MGALGDRLPQPGEAGVVLRRQAVPEVEEAQQVDDPLSHPVNLS